MTREEHKIIVIKRKILSALADYKSGRKWEDGQTHVITVTQNLINHFGEECYAHVLCCELDDADYQLQMALTNGQLNKHIQYMKRSN